MNAATGEVLFDRNGDRAELAPAACSRCSPPPPALSALGPDYRFTTQVVEGSAPGSIVLVGGGDATLASGGGNVYPERRSHR